VLRVQILLLLRYFFFVFLASLMSTSFLSALLLHLLGAFRGGSCLLVIAAQNPIHSLLLLIRLFLLGTLLLFTLQREYFALLFLLVYVGAIVVLFLFVIRRLELKRVNTTRRLRDLLSYRHLAVALLLLEALLLLSQESFDLSPFLAELHNFPVISERNGYTDRASLLHRTDSLRGLGGLLYTEYAPALLIAALLLTVARVGAILLTLVGSENSSSVTQTAEGLSTLPTRVVPPRQIKRQEGEHQARRHPSLQLVYTRF
jgi:NADH-quinone oxidoreductase subunit J